MESCYRMVDVSNLSNETLQDEYSKLYKLCLELCKAKEEDNQRIHELKRSLDTANAAESYLTQELEQMTNTLKSANCKDQNKIELKLHELQSKYNDLEVENANIQHTCDTLRAENSHLRNCLREATINLSQESAKIDAEQQRKREQELEEENFMLLAKLEECKDLNAQQSMAIAQLERNVENLREQVNCAEENMRCKRDEVAEMNALLESTQEKLTEANAKIAALTQETDTNKKKGNSLFAEVDDQRQAMKRLLLAQKSSYMQMKKAHNESEHEIRRLKRENTAMHMELQACSSIFRDADKTYQEKLIERIQLLLSEKENLEKKLKSSQDLLKEVARDNGVLWLDPMLNFCKQETIELSKQLHSLRIQKASLEEQLRNCTQEMARWRFETLKLKCVLIDRENILTENHIQFKPINEMQISINNKPLDAQPHLLQTNNEQLNSSVQSKDVPSKLATSSPFKDIQNILAQSPSKTIPTTSPLTFSSDENKENTPPSQRNKNDKKNKFTQPQQGSPLSNLNRNVCSVVDSFNKLTITEQRKTGTPLEVKPMSPSIHSKDAKSILRKGQNIFNEESMKSVKFSNECKEIKTSIDTHEFDNNTNNKTTIKQIHTKSNIIIRKVILKSKN